MSKIGKIMTKTCDIIVAHYKENLTWLKGLYHPNIRQIRTYTKSDTSTSTELSGINNKINRSFLPNVGRESDTYLRYCIEYIDNLPDFVIFLQGDPNLHGINRNKVITWINCFVNNEYNYTPSFINSNIFQHMHPDGRIHNWKGMTNKNNLNMIDWSNKFVRKNIDYINSKVCYGANFGVGKCFILSRPIQDYHTIVEDLDSINPESGHYMERSWYYFFNLDMKV